MIRETYVVDFKEGVDPKKLSEHAKDIAAFANALGGTIVVGSKELPDGVEYHGLPPDVAREAAEGYRLAVRDRVRPRPRVDVVELRSPLTDRIVAAVNVHAFPDQAVGCAVDIVRDDRGATKEASGDALAWRFPQRVANHTRWIQPEELAMLINGPARRAAVLLEGIPSDLRHAVEVQNWHVRQKDHPSVVKCGLENVDLVANAVLVAIPVGQMPTRLRIPLDDVEAVWEASPKVWRLRVNGILQQVGNDRTWMYYSYPRHS